MAGYDQFESGLTGIGSYSFYRDNSTGPALTTSYRSLDFIDDFSQTEFLSIGVTIANDAPANDITLSWDNVHPGFVLKAGETLTFPNKRARKLYIKGQAGAEPYRISAW